MNVEILRCYEITQHTKWREKKWNNLQMILFQGTKIINNTLLTIGGNVFNVIESLDVGVDTVKSFTVNKMDYKMDQECKISIG